MKKITVVIPNLNGMQYLEGCLSSLRKQSEQSFETILIDNGSEDGSVPFVRSHFPEVKVRAYRRNTGFCHAVNDGILLARTPYVLLLNNDTVCERDMLRALLDAMERGGEKVFSCGAKMVSLSRPEELDDAGDFFCVLGWAFARGKGRNASLYRKEEECFSCCAAAALYRKSVLEEIGLFDERHFAYLEDVDIGWRAANRGYRNLYVPSAVVRHAGSATSGSRHNEFKVKMAAGNSLYTVWKNMPPWQLALNAPFLFAGTLIKRIYFTGKGLGRAYAEGLSRGRCLIRTAAAGSGPVWPFSMRERMEKAGMGKPDGRGRFLPQVRCQLKLLRGLVLLTEFRR